MSDFQYEQFCDGLIDHDGPEEECPLTTSLAFYVEKTDAELFGLTKRARSKKVVAIREYYDATLAPLSKAQHWALACWCANHID